MCQYTNEPDGVHTFLVLRIMQLEEEIADLKLRLEEAQLRSIEARNPGIDMEEVKRMRRKI